MTMATLEDISRMLSTVIAGQKDLKQQVEDGREESRKTNEETREKLEEMQRDQKALASEVREIKEGLTKRVDELEESVKKLELENQQLRIELLDVRLENSTQEQYSKSRNILLFDIPGAPREPKETSKKIAESILTLAGCPHKAVVAHRQDARKNNGPILVQFEAKPYAIDALKAIRNTKITVAQLKLPGEENNTKTINGKAHLCMHLQDLLKVSNALVREANWKYAKPLTSEIAVEIKEDDGAKGVIVREIADVLNLREQLIRTGKIPKSPPGEKYNLRRNKRKVDDGQERAAKAACV